MKFLLTNDDGYNHPGINLVKKVLENYGEVIICAPLYPQSGKACAITIRHGLKLTKMAENVYAVDGTPADCVRLGNITLGDFDYVVSGCNEGFNISTDTLYSGTVGAGLQGLIDRKKVICLSAHYKNYEVVENELKNLFEFIFTNNIASNEYLLNVNFPSFGFKTAKGIKITKDFIKRYICYPEQRQDSFIVMRKDNGNILDKESDCYLVEEGYITITPLQLSLFSLDAYDKLKKLNN